MLEEEKLIRQKLKDDYVHYALKCLKIRDKDGFITPFTLNRAQRYLHDKVEQQKLEKGLIRCIILKGRQQGISTYVEGRFYWKVTHRFGVRAFILTHAVDATNNLFEMANRYHEHCPSIVRPEIEASNSKELIFGALDSGYKLGTAANKSVGRSSTIQYLHGSEVALWANAPEHAKGIFQAVPYSKDTEIFLESTAMGVGNYFHEQWQLAEKGITDFIPIFIPWFWQDEYRRKIAPDVDFILNDDEKELIEVYGLTIEQLEWRRKKILDANTAGINGDKAFKQEYPCTPAEAFQETGTDIIIEPQLAVRAAKNENIEAVGKLLIGVDPARFGDDRTSIIRRRGRVAYKLESHTKKDTMQVAGRVHNIIMEESPDKVFIDVVGLGAGVYDRLRELGHENVLVAVNVATEALNEKRYGNKRAEVWFLMKQWLMDNPCSIPNSGSLISDLCSPTYKEDSRGRLMVERKEDMKKRGIKSPDEGDALALTFALPFSALVSHDLTKNRKAARIMSHQERVGKLRERVSY